VLFQRAADLEIGDTADLEVCATPVSPASANSAMKYPASVQILGLGENSGRPLEGEGSLMTRAGECFFSRLQRPENSLINKP